ncbi:MAG: hypothetical protein M1396_01915 [Chloroflexi bacterium]|nr:hypothetical protein [Chloroflexota bacterium]
MVLLKKQYHCPELVEYGRAIDLTMGASGPQADYVVIGGTLNVDNNNPTCTNNVGGSSGCVHW